MNKRIIKNIKKKSIKNFNNFVSKKIINIPDLPSGIYNCVNPNPLSTAEVCDILDEYGLWNPNWKFIDYQELKQHITANRSNCSLSTDKLKIYGLDMPSERESLVRILKETPDEG